ncbi:VOC family protein [soil metagenome]
MKHRATGIGGVFFKAKDPAKLGAWYREHLGLPVDEQWNGFQFHWRDHKNPKQTGSTTWTAFKADTKYFGGGKGTSGGQAHMINYRVTNLNKMLAQLKKAGVWIDPKSPTLDPAYGNFAWIKDNEGNRIELWEPPAPAKPKTKSQPKKKNAA